MAGDSFFGFPDFSDDSRSEEPEILYGNMHPDFHGLYASTVGQSDTYAEMSDLEKYFMADEFMEIFYYGGYTLADQEEWLAILGLREADFNWDEYRAIYESV